MIIYYVKISDNEYVLQCNNPNSTVSNGYSMSYTPTHIFTYPGGCPKYLRDIQKIEYTKSNVSFYKDCNNNMCCIDIYDDPSNPNKCRIIGLNGQCIFCNDNYHFEVYDVSNESNSFINNKPRLIYIDQHNGLYIVSKNENPIKNISDGYHYTRKFTFKGEIIEISAIDGQRKVSGFDASNEIFSLNCPSKTPVSYKIEPTSVMKQIEEMVGVKLVTPPPSDESALARVSEIFDIPVELLTMSDGKVCLIRPTAYSPCIKNKTYDSMRLEEKTFALWESYIDELYEFLSIVITDGLPLAKACATLQSLTLEKYHLNNSDEGKQRRKEIALRPWPEVGEFDPFLKQIEKITGIKLLTSPPSKEHALKRMALILDVPIEILTMIDGKVYLVYLINKNNNRKEEALKNYFNQLKSFVSPISYGLSRTKIYNYDIIIRWIKNYTYDCSDKAQEYRKKIVMKPWTEEIEDFTPFIEQIKELTGIKLKTPPPCKESALIRVSELLNVPIEMLIMKDNKVHLIDTISLNINSRGWVHGDQYINQLKNILPLYSGNLIGEHINDIRFNVNYNWNGVYYKFDNSCSGKQKRMDIILKPWDII